jgi:hypothetical protein
MGAVGLVGKAESKKGGDGCEVTCVCPINVSKLGPESSPWESHCRQKPTGAPLLQKAGLTTSYALWAVPSEFTILDGLITVSEDGLYDQTTLVAGG